MDMAINSPFMVHAFGNGNSPDFVEEKGTLKFKRARLPPSAAHPPTPPCLIRRSRSDANLQLLTQFSAIEEDDDAALVLRGEAVEREPGCFSYFDYKCCFSRR